MARSWGHRVWPLTAAAADEHDRWNRRCTTGRCTAPVTHHTSYRCVTSSRSGRDSASNSLVCTHHADRFAARHGIFMEAAPDTAPPPEDTMQPAPHTVSVQRDAGGTWYARLMGGGFVVAAAIALQAENLDEAIRAAEANLALSRREVPVTAWSRTETRATVQLGKAEDQPDWADADWTLDVSADTNGCWWLRRSLADHLAPIREGLGDTGMTLERALRVATAILSAQCWQLLGEWQIDHDRASNHARRPAATLSAPPTADHSL